MISHKYAEFSSPRVQIDLEENHGRAVSRCLIQDVADAVAAAALAKEEDWSYALPKFEEPPATVAVSLDGTCLLMCEDGWRETMVGTLGLLRPGGRAAAHDLPGGDAGVRQGDVPGPPGGGDRPGQGEVPRGPLRGDRRRGQGELGVPGAAHRRAGDRLLACGGVPGQGGGGAVPGPAPAPGRRGWRTRCHRLKHEPGGAEWVLKRLRSLARERPWAKDDEDVQRAITYFAQPVGAGRMDYASRVAANEPIGSGVTEAACKVIVKQRLCGSGMKWTEAGAAAVLSLRCLELHDRSGGVSSGRRSIGGASRSPPERRSDWLYIKSSVEPLPSLRPRTSSSTSYNWAIKPST